MTDKCWAIRSRLGVKLEQQELKGVSEMATAVLAAYYVLCLSHQTAYGQILELLQSVLLGQSFEEFATAGLCFQNSEANFEILHFPPFSFYFVKMIFFVYSLKES